MNRRAAFVTGLFASGFSALPAALRFASGLRWQAFLVCLAGSALVIAPLAAALAGSSATAKFKSTLTFGIVLAALPLLPFAGLLKTTTHHRALGGVTFAVIAGISVVGVSLFGARLHTWAGAQRRTARGAARAAWWAVFALGFSAILLGSVRCLEGGDAYRTGLFDALRALALATLAARVPIPGGLLQRLRGLGLAAWIAVVTVGVCFGRAPAMQAELATRCPVLHWPLVWLGG